MLQKGNNSQELLSSSLVYILSLAFFKQFTPNINNCSYNHLFLQLFDMNSLRNLNKTNFYIKLQLN